MDVLDPSLNAQADRRRSIPGCCRGGADRLFAWVPAHLPDVVLFVGARWIAQGISSMEPGGRPGTRRPALAGGERSGGWRVRGDPAVGDRASGAGPPLYAPKLACAAAVGAGLC